MTITNGYCTLPEFKDYLLRKRSYVASTISFTQSSATIADSFKRLGRFQNATLIQVAGAANAGNNGVFVVVSVANGAIVVEGTLTDAVVGTAITLTDVSNAEDDATIEIQIEAASRAVDHFTKRKFWSNNQDESRIYSPEWFDCFYCPDDILSITTLATDRDGDGVFETVWATSDYVLGPANAALEGRPCTKIGVARNGSYTFPKGAKNALKLTGKFGWTAVPSLVKNATLLQASRWYERRNAPFGVVAITEAGAVTLKNDLDPDVQVMLKPVARTFLV
jgi:hypothetical protein